MSLAQEVGGTVIGEDGLVVMAGAELVEWSQIHQTHAFHSMYKTKVNMYVYGDSWSHINLTTHSEKAIPDVVKCSSLICLVVVSCGCCSAEHQALCPSGRGYVTGPGAFSYKGNDGLTYTQGR